MEQGTIARLVTDRGFGFIAREGEEKDLFFHSEGLVAPLKFEELKEGEEMTFEVAEGKQGPNAVNVSRV